MQVTVDKEYPVAARPDIAWKILSEIHELTGCMPGAQITEDVDATHYKGSVKVKVGPAVAAFAGTIEVLERDEVTGTLRMLGKGADKGGSSASMDLTATIRPGANSASTLHGKAEVIVNGKFAQFGGRMMASVSDVILAQFADAFSKKAEALQASSSAPQAAAPAIQAVAVAAAAVPVAAVMSSQTAANPQPAAGSELNALGVMWALIRNWFLGLLGRKT
jgi:uncharacterized protein